MDYSKFFRTALNRLHDERRYRVFADLERIAGRFPHAIWHGPQPNHSGKARKTILYNYCQMFMRAYDYSGPYTKLFERCTPRQRRLLGDLGHGPDFRPGDFFYAPTDQEALMTGTA